MSNKFDAGQWKKLELTLVEECLGDISLGAYEESVIEVICGHYDLPEGSSIDISWRDVGSTNIILCYEGEQIEDFRVYEIDRAINRERAFIRELLERAFTLACERA